MEIIYGDKELKKCATDKSYALKKMGQRRALYYVLRIAQIGGASDFEKLRGLSGHYHELVGNRAGQWACDLDQPYRLIFKSTNEGPVAQIVWSQEKIAKFLEIVDYHR
ncbi:MAG: killer suppression protein HigA [Alphaproteobacteria bacterium]|jgi:proteic killer suppression protein|uniref:type II toxin-antitoxin system RelE/ParE family toxin n=1 Tax=Fibrobacter sp. TaxID=35828 RepID=UPI001B11D1C6|nr:killer suppression protein HigA [Alphaproteobacteria bacterium]